MNLMWLLFLSWGVGADICLRVNMEIRKQVVAEGFGRLIVGWV